jgi:3D-(3,5/4)-trihydroxycyclohexane-1,2-dione acylhydrolase (decyclizing)
MVETTAGRTLVPHDHPLHGGPLGITGSASANALAAQADVVLAAGTRLQDFTTASWTVFNQQARLVALNAARFDAVKHGAVALVADADEGLRELGESLADWRAPQDWSAQAGIERARWDAHIDALRAETEGPLTYAQVVGAVNEQSGPTDYVMTASGGMPGELIGGWRGTGSSTMDVEYGFSCMGYELAGAWGAAMARPDGVVTTLLGDGSYLMLNSEIFSAAFAGHGFVAVVCDNDGYAVIARLQEGQGGQPFNNMYADCRSGSGGQARTDFAAHAASLGAAVFPVEGGLAEFSEAYRSARKAATDRPAVVVVRTHPSSWTESGAWWEVGAPREEPDAEKANQVRYLHQ